MCKINQFDIVYVDLDGAIGSEQSKTRPCVVIQNDTGNAHSPTLIVLPLTKEIKKPLPTHVFVPMSKAKGLQYNSTVLAEQVRVVDKRRVKEVIGRITDGKIKNDIISAYFINATGVAVFQRIALFLSQILNHMYKWY